MHQRPKEDCPHRNSTGWVRVTYSPSDDEPCECTDPGDDEIEEINAP